jgi:hypothetical protein
VPRDRKDVRAGKVETMVRSKEEWQRIQEEEDREPFMPGLTWGEFDRLPRRQQDHARQKLWQTIICSLGYFKTCDLASCRSAKACKGFLSEEQYRSGRYRFPPRSGEGGRLQSEVLAQGWRIAGFPDGKDPGPETT